MPAEPRRLQLLTRAACHLCDVAAETLERIAFLLERGGERAYRVRAFRTAAATLSAISPEEVSERDRTGRLQELPGVGDTTARVVHEALAGEVPGYLARLEAAPAPDPGPGAAIRSRLRGDCHTHSDWSDGGSPIETMARTAAALGHDYMVLTDHSPSLTVANGLSAERLERQLEVVAEVNAKLAPFRMLTGVEVDILEDGSLDQDEALLARLDVVVASVHSKLRMDEKEMTPRMIRAVSNPRVNILGHCTGRIVVGRGRPESQFDADAVFAACAEHDTAVEINSRPERLDPPRRLLKKALSRSRSTREVTTAMGGTAVRPCACRRARRSALGRAGP